MFGRRCGGGRGEVAVCGAVWCWISMGILAGVLRLGDGQDLCCDLGSRIFALIAVLGNFFLSGGSKIFLVVLVFLSGSISL